MNLHYFRASWSFIRLAQLILGLFALGYFVRHPNEWISILIGLGLSYQAIFRSGCDPENCN